MAQTEAERMVQQDQAFGPHLGKATYDEFTYAVGMRDGTVYRCGNAEVVGEWVLLTGGGCWSVEYYEEAVFMFTPGTWPGPIKDYPDKGVALRRGVQVRLADIAWVADAPEGS